MSLKNFLKSIIPQKMILAYHYVLAWSAAMYYGFPSESMIIIGVTGTKGKSTSVYLLAKVLEAAGLKVGVSSSLIFKIGADEWVNPYHMTMAGRFRMQEFLWQAKSAGCTHVIIEVTSEGIRQSRHKFINFDKLVFTNLSPEHIESHGGFENYKNTKGRIFAEISGLKNKKINGKEIEKTFILNLDDEYASYFASFSSNKKYGFSLKNNCEVLPKSEDNICFPISNYHAEPRSIDFHINSTDFVLHLLGECNIYNSACVAVVAKSLGVDFSVSKQALKRIEYIPGRMQFINAGQKFIAIVDLAHTPSSYEELFKAIKSLKQEKGRIITVMGSAGGGRDKWKRPELGKIAARNSDYIIITNEDPYKENPVNIFSAIEDGIKAENYKGVLQIIEDRKQAIKTAVNIARYNDVVVFLGKGTEQTMMMGDEAIPWSEESIVSKEIKSMLYDRK